MNANTIKNRTMKNNASNPSIIQALQARAQQLLPIITQSLLAESYNELVHQRLSEQRNEQKDGQSRKQNQDAKTYEIINNHYQGLTRAHHLRFGEVMIKWALTPSSNSSLVDLNHEVEVLTAINALLQHSTGLAADKLIAVAPPILAYRTLTLQNSECLQQLTILVMPYYPNGSLANQLSAKKHLLLTEEKKYHFIVESGHLIANLHSTGWLHNDIKPSNFLLDDMLLNQAKNSSLMPNLLLTDFALAEHCGNSSSSHPAGTPAYLAPERWQGQSATTQSDIYAFGIMMFEILMGERPFNVRTKDANLLKAWAIQHCQATLPTLPSEYSRYQHVINKALAKRVEKRYQGMEEVLSDLTLLINVTN